MRKIEMKLVDGEFENPLKQPLRFPSDLVSIFGSIKDEASETLLAVYLQNDLTGNYDVHSVGGSSATLLSIGDLFGKAYVLRARYMILIHNHPKGDPSPSKDDILSLKSVAAHAGTLPALDILDYIIVGDGKYWSYFEEEDGGEYSLGSIGIDINKLPYCAENSPEQPYPDARQHQKH